MPTLMRMTLTWKLSAICGREVDMMVASRFSMKNATATISGINMEGPPTHCNQRPIPTAAPVR